MVKQTYLKVKQVIFHESTSKNSPESESSPEGFLLKTRMGSLRRGSFHGDAGLERSHGKPSFVAHWLSEIGSKLVRENNMKAF